MTASTNAGTTARTSSFCDATEESTTGRNAASTYRDTSSVQCCSSSAPMIKPCTVFALNARCSTGSTTAAISSWLTLVRRTSNAAAATAPSHASLDEHVGSTRHRRKWSTNRRRSAPSSASAVGVAAARYRNRNVAPATAGRPGGSANTASTNAAVTAGPRPKHLNKPRRAAASRCLPRGSATSAWNASVASSVNSTTETRANHSGVAPTSQAGVAE